MLLNMNEKKKNTVSDATNLKDDEVLESLLGEIKSNKQPATSSLSKSKPNQMRNVVKTEAPVNPFARPKSTGLKVSKPTAIKRPPPEEMVDNADTALDMLDQEIMEEVSQEIKEEQPMDTSEPTQVIEEFTEAELSSFMDEDFIDDSSQQPKEDEKIQCNRGFFESKEQKKNKPDLSAKISESNFDKDINETVLTDVHVDHGDLPLIQNEQGDKVLRMYWLDAYEDTFKHPGTVWLFGKVFVESVKSFVSCCLTVKNIKRQVFLLKRQGFYDLESKKDKNDGREVSMTDVYKEFNAKIAEKYKISEFRSKTSEKLYAFEYTDVPNKAEYLEAQYSSKYPALPQDLQGETFSKVFGANQSSLEQFLISRKIKGPGWLEIKMASAVIPATSWCKVEGACEDPLFVTPLGGKSPPPPPLTAIAINMKTIINPKSLLNEIALVSCLVHDEIYLDRPAPKQPFKMHFCAMTKPADEVWPFDFQKVLAQHKGTKIEKMESERALLGFLLAKIGKLDPDIIIGHDITGK